MQEYDMMVELYDRGIPLPIPYEQKDFAYSMELLGTEIGPSPLLKEVNLLELGFDPIDVLENILDIYYKMFAECYVAHGDFNEHNLIWHNNRIFVIDVLQAQKYNSNNISPFASKGNYISKIEAYELLERDITSIIRHFRQKYSVSFDTEEVIELMMNLQGEDSLWYQTYQYIHGERHFSR
jgi:serine/threonine-protein kinase RIO1